MSGVATRSATVPSVTPKPANPFLGLLEGAAPREGPAWLASLRRSGAERFAAVGIPTSRDEDWRFTPLQALATGSFGAPAAARTLASSDLAPWIIGRAEWPLLVVVDGRVNAGLSRMPGLAGGATLGSLAGAIAASSPTVASHLGQIATPLSTPFTALSAALFSDGVVLDLPANVVLETPIHVLHVATSAAAGALLAPRTLVVLGANAKATLVESFVSLDGGAYFTNACAEISLAAGARFEHTRVQREADAASHIGFTGVSQERDSHYRSFTLALGGKLARHDLQTRLNAPGIETLLYGLYLARGEQLIDNHTAIFHDQPHCNSWEVYKGVLAEHSRAVFNGKVIVQPAAQKTDAKQTNRNLLLSDDCRVDTKPQLEIFADDVRCTHGATVGKLDGQQRYYLRTRGIAGRTAQALLIWAFVAEVLAEITQPEVRSALEAVVHAELDALIAP